MSRRALPLYGLAEIAAALDVSRKRVGMWRVRGQLPPPDAVLASGPVWLASTIEPWMDRAREAARIGRVQGPTGD